MKQLIFIFFISFLLFSYDCSSQKISWLNFKQLEDSLAVKPKKVLLFFYADWCEYCKKMEQTAFKNKDIINILNSNFYAVKMDAESDEEIIFDGVKYSNKNLGKSRTPYHEIPLLLASRKNVEFSLPATLILDKNFTVQNRYFEYLSPKKLKIILEKTE